MNQTICDICGVVLDQVDITSNANLYANFHKGNTIQTHFDLCPTDGPRAIAAVQALIPTPPPSQ